ncbi:MAG: hypothetical protein ABIG44_03715 [Planctomycetota bacterium]
MRRRSRTRRMLKWTGTAASVFLLCLYLLSLVRSVVYWNMYFDIMLDCGVVYIEQFEYTGDAEWISRWQDRRRPILGFHHAAPTAFVYIVAARTLPVRFGLRLPQFTRIAHPASRGRPVNSRVTTVTAPLWLGLAPMGAVTALLWWLDRRNIPPGHCRKCGYNLTGNVSGVCPECGEAI